MNGPVKTVVAKVKKVAGVGLLVLFTTTLWQQPSAASEPTLQEVFDAFFGPGVINTTQETGRMTFPAGRYKATLIARDTAKPLVPIGWYPVGSPGVLTEIFPATATPPTTVELVIPEEFGLWVSTFDLWKSQPALNSDGFDHFLVFNGPGSGFAVAVEDLRGGGDLDFQDRVVFFQRLIEVPVDIKPRSCPNPINVYSNGVLPVAILGTSQFDVTKVDVRSVRLVGVSPLRWGLQDVATPFPPFVGEKDAFDCTEQGGDGFLDLSLKFRTRAVVAALGPVADGEVGILRLTGNLKPQFGSVPIVGEDVVVILKHR